MCRFCGVDNSIALAMFSSEDTTEFKEEPMREANMTEIAHHAEMLEAGAKNAEDLYKKVAQACGAPVAAVAYLLSGFAVEQAVHPSTQSRYFRK